MCVIRTQFNMRTYVDKLVISLFSGREVQIPNIHSIHTPL